MDPSPDYDVSDEIEFFFRYQPGVYAGSKPATDTRRRRIRPSEPALARYNALSSSETSVTDFFASPNNIVVPSA